MPSQGEPTTNSSLLEESGPDDPITKPTNRGNKLQANARFVREGALGYINPGNYYKQKVEHAGYTRFTIMPNPRRYDSEGDELDEGDEDSGADAAAAEENPFSDTVLENLLCPLKHPSELPVHSSMSHPYTSKALWNMAQAIEAKLHQERVLLWRARNLHRQFLGDTSWIPCGSVETPEDRFIFQRKVTEADDLYMDRCHKHDHAPVSASGAQNGEAQELPSDTDNKGLQSSEGQTDREIKNNSLTADIHSDGPEPGKNKGSEQDIVKHDSENEEERAASTRSRKEPDGRGDDDNTMGHRARAKLPTESIAVPSFCWPERADIPRTTEEAVRTDTEHGNETREDIEMRDIWSPKSTGQPAIQAKSNAENRQEKLPSPLSDSVLSLPSPHPLFFVPDAIRPDSNFGLPPNEAEETRRLLWSYVQKQEETVRGFEHMLNSLLRACQMKDDVFEWCKAEGHLGEMSDGEDWYDRGKWSLAEGEELKKGADDDEMDAVDDTRTTGKRGRGRRA